jgi:formylglycine-generating enzyme required for sulfatase activity
VLAFEMAREGNFAEVPQDDMPRFRRHVWQQHRDHCDWESQAEFNRQLQLLGKLNVFMEYAVSDHSELQDICWKNRSLQEFFAGLWLARYAPEADRPWIRQAIYLPDDKVTAELYWMWRFAAEMPATGRSATCWVHSMAPLYDPGDGTAQGTWRSTEMLYRSWSTMQAYACAGGKVADMADRLLGGFQAEFPEILAGSRGPDAQRIAEDFLKQFQPIPPAVESAAALHFRMGSPPTEAERYADKELYETAVPRQFELACYPVTNQQYELFHPSHRERRDEYSSDDRCPVVWVTWYDAWAFCHWLGPSYRLPSEKEWEFACRAGSTTPFHFGDALTSTQANFDGYYPYGGAPKGPYLRRTTAVGSYPPNAWKLYDMHGNVWEWCDTWYDASAAVSDDPKHFGSARVLRGGSWLGNAGYARSAFRLDWRPSLSVNYGGFRVARALG